MSSPQLSVPDRQAQMMKSDRVLLNTLRDSSSCLKSFVYLLRAGLSISLLELVDRVVTKCLRSALYVGLCNPCLVRLA